MVHPQLRFKLHQLPSCHPSTGPLSQLSLSISPPCFPASRSKFPHSYYPLSFTYCPWGLVVLPTEWPLDSDLLYPYHSCSIQVLITSCLDWFVSKSFSSLFTPSILPLFACHILIKTMISFYCTATNPLERNSFCSPPPPSKPGVGKLPVACFVRPKSWECFSYF